VRAAEVRPEATRRGILASTRLENSRVSPSVLDLRCPHRYANIGTADDFRRADMQGVKGAIILTAVIAAVALGACRREVPHEPLKLGGPAAEKVQ
jgi:hypothetical protein